MDSFIKNFSSSEGADSMSLIHFGIGWFREEVKSKEKNYTSSDILKLLEFIADMEEKEE